MDRTACTEPQCLYKVALTNKRASGVMTGGSSVEPCAASPGRNFVNAINLNLVTIEDHRIFTFVVIILILIANLT